MSRTVQEACQVESSDSKDQRNSEQTQEELEEEMSHYWDYSIDLPAHFLVSFAVPPGFLAWRRQLSDGESSFYINALVKVFDDNKDKDVDIKKLLTKVASEVAAKAMTPSGQDSAVKQMPCFVSALTKSLHLCDKK
ncbi:caspase-6-like isoform X3 [Ornithodoros turicata]|uniref:caspase-6-like isoform X3 n=1 Tax=Ornithodoros turicata TaxID=34597 RepID=UPI00313A4949